LKVADRPLLSFVLLAYNHERYIAEAVQGALAQTYSPLEIILSDDCSTDGTFEALKAAVADYRGPHHIKLNRNPRNLGIGGHVNRVMELAEGTLIVVAAGDDVSLPNRVQRTWEVWEESCHRPSLLYFNFVPLQHYAGHVPEAERVADLSIAAQCERAGAKVHGCAAAWHPRLFEVFGPLPPDVVSEDRVLPFRASLLGPVVHGSDVVVRYRFHEGNTSWEPSATRETFDGWLRSWQKGLAWQTATLKSFRKDLLTAREKGLLGEGETADYLRRVATALEKRETETDLLSANFGRRLRSASRLWTPRYRQRFTVARRCMFMANAFWPGLIEWERCLRSRRKDRPCPASSRDGIRCA
jgi:glycosyltransferase involved in cell wall biosynthesis